MEIVLSLSGGCAFGRQLARCLKAKHVVAKDSFFPDGEVYVRIPVPIKGRRVIVVQTLHPNPNDRLLELFFALKTCRELGASRVDAVVPYLAYMRQDKRFKPGEAVSNRLSALLYDADALYSFDPHLHRAAKLKEIFRIRAVKLSANTAIADYAKKHYPAAVLVGPDLESYKWARAVAEMNNQDFVILEKRRLGSRRVRITGKNLGVLKGREAVLVDDMASTGHTLVEAARVVRRAGGRVKAAICVHPLFVEDAVNRLKKAGIGKIISTNTIPHSTNRIDVSPIAAEALR
ncbi:ribose-phosphate diphosphokinase [Candidatus Woesearchaeota archaeon]|nr:ribose-phosphate diphosphokinase [Candidatus Woesearchaeota archaeon]